MTAAEISVLAVTLGFALLLYWVYAPRRRGRLESYAAIPLDDDEHPADRAGGRRR